MDEVGGKWEEGELETNLVENVHLLGQPGSNCTHVGSNSSRQ